MNTINGVVKVFSSIALLGSITMMPIAANAQSNMHPWLPDTVTTYTNYLIRNQRIFNSLSPYQQNLVRAASQAIWNYQQNTGQLVYPNQQNVIAIMQTIGARSNDYHLVARVVQENYTIANANQTMDSFLQDTYRMLNSF